MVICIARASQETINSMRQIGRLTDTLIIIIMVSLLKVYTLNIHKLFHTFTVVKKLVP